jgi:transposase
MPDPIPVEVRAAAVAAYLRKEGTRQEVAARFGLSPISLQRYLTMHRQGSLAPKTQQRWGRMPILTEAEREVLRELALGDGQATEVQLIERLDQR